MAENNATILIPDISGFTEFITNTELSHGSFAINLLIDAIIKAVGDEYEVAEIEGDAVLLVSKGSAPSRKHIQEISLKIFNAFHFQRKWLQQHAVCPCGACVSIANLTLKFVAHYGPLAEMKVGRFVKQSGPEMVVAHRLLKNSIDNNEYLLISEKLLGLAPDASGASELEWTHAHDEYASIGKVRYRFALLNKARNDVPEPPKLRTYNFADPTPYLTAQIPVAFRDAYMVVMNIPGRTAWVPDLLNVEQEIPQVFIGSVHQCTFAEFKSIVSPLRMSLSSDGIIYAESCQIKAWGLDLSLVYEYVFRKTGDKACRLDCRIINESESDVPAAVNASLVQQLRQMIESLKARCIEMEGSLFEPTFQRD